MSDALHKSLEKKYKPLTFGQVDGDEVRNLFNNHDFSAEGRLRNLERVSDIAVYMNQNNFDYVIISAVYPYQKSRDYLMNAAKGDVLLVRLVYDNPRGREDYHVKDFENDISDYLYLNTDLLTLDECVNIILNRL